ncbi:MAG: hypothetical protein LBO79_07405 [Zoogloeaceae bacterium]|nr:hypothetical protein [Zoogloeaceae bacterium]
MSVKQGIREAQPEDAQGGASVAHGGSSEGCGWLPDMGELSVVSRKARNTSANRLPKT